MVGGSRFHRTFAAGFGAVANAIALLALIQACDGKTRGPSPAATPTTTPTLGGGGKADPARSGKAAVASGCPVPTLPSPPASKRVVGNGSPGSCTFEALRDAVAAGGHITFACGTGPTTIPIPAELRVAKEVFIDGADTIALDGKGASRIFYGDSGVPMTLTRLLLKNGKSKATEGNANSGGAVFSGYRSTLHIEGVTFEDNLGGASGEEGGGAVYAKSGGKVVIVRSTFRRNKGGTGGAVNTLLSDLLVVDSEFNENDSTSGAPASSGYGAAIYTDGASEKIDDALGGEIRVCGSRFVANRGAGQGGGAFLFVYPPDTIVIERSHFEGNSVVANAKGDALGGALRVGNGELSLARSSFVGNTAKSQGGAFWTDGKKPAKVVNVTFHGNKAVDGPQGLGGAVMGTNVSFSHVTFSSNHAGFMGGAVWGDSGNSLANSLFSGNTAGNPWKIQQYCQAKYAESGAIVQWPGLQTTDPKDTNCSAGAIIADPTLGALASTTEGLSYVPFGKGSPAEGKGSRCEPIDIRGQARPAEKCDVGAFELP